MSMTDIHAEHTVAEHQHGPGCGHEDVKHGDHMDYIHNGHTTLWTATTTTSTKPRR